MSSLQKFHRRTLSVGAYVAVDTLVPTNTVGDGSGDDTKGYYLGGFSDGQKMYVAPKSTEVQRTWGSYGTIRGTTFVNNGLANTNTLAGFGSTTVSGHPAAYYCKTLTVGGYNTWYLPAIDELTTLYSNRNKTPFATSNGFISAYYLSSTERNDNGKYAWGEYMTAGIKAYPKKSISYYVRAVRRSAI